MKAFRDATLPKNLVLANQVSAIRPGQHINSRHVGADDGIWAEQKRPLIEQDIAGQVPVNLGFMKMRALDGAGNPKPKALLMKGGRAFFADSKGDHKYANGSLINADAEVRARAEAEAKYLFENLASKSKEAWKQLLGITEAEHKLLKKGYPPALKQALLEYGEDEDLIDLLEEIDCTYAGMRAPKFREEHLVQMKAIMLLKVSNVIVEYPSLHSTPQSQASATQIATRAGGATGTSSEKRPEQGDNSVPNTSDE